MYLTKQNVIVSGPEFILFKAHWLRAIATASALVKHQGAMLFPQLIDYLFSLFGYLNACYIHFNRGKKNPRSSYKRGSLS